MVVGILENAPTIDIQTLKGVKPQAVRLVLAISNASSKQSTEALTRQDQFMDFIYKVRRYLISLRPICSNIPTALASIARTTARPELQNMV